MRRVIAVLGMAAIVVVLGASSCQDIENTQHVTNPNDVAARCANRACSGPRPPELPPTTTTTVMSAQFTPGPAIVEYVDRGRLIHCTDFGEWGWCDDMGPAPVR